MPSCFGSCFGFASLVPPDHTELSREQLKSLYEKSITLNEGRLIVHGIFARADTKNNNKRVYPKYILKREVAKYEKEHIQKGTALGELDHPNYASRYFKCLNLPNISHQVLDVQWKGDQLWGSIEILPTPSGLLLWELYSQGIKLGVSSRGWASLRTDPKAKCVYVDDDFELITFDFVTEPSTKGAYLVPIRKAYKFMIPDQSKCVQISHLGHGVVSMQNIPKLPEATTIVARINQLQAECMDRAGVIPPAALSAAISSGPSASKLQGLDKLLLYSHYVVFQDAAYLDRETHARDFRSHLAMFATRAHLADQQQVMNRSDLNAVIMQEIAKDEAVGHGKYEGAAAAARPGMTASQSIGNLKSSSNNGGDEYQAGATRLNDAECQGAPVNDLGAWSLHPNALDITGSEHVAPRPQQAYIPGDGTSSRSSVTPASPCQLVISAHHADYGGDVTASCSSGEEDMCAVQNRWQRGGSGGQDGYWQGPGSVVYDEKGRVSGGSPYSHSGLQGGMPPTVNGHQGKLNATPPRRSQQQSAAAGPLADDTSSEVEQVVRIELQRIKATLAAYASKYQERQDALRRALHVSLPQSSIAAGVMLQFAKHR
mmetsp:Transcript_32615/g.72047  ORF Transcript_32615/g.72047 Transcript_32615/m.72047 type:complete len:600 (+) Transcript_32615:290-2089(+)